MRKIIFLAALAAAAVVGCATHKTKPDLANPVVVPEGGTTGSLSTDTDIQILAVNSKTNAPGAKNKKTKGSKNKDLELAVNANVPDLIPDPTMTEPPLQTSAVNHPLNDIPSQTPKVVGQAVITASLNPPDMMVTTVPAIQVTPNGTSPSNAINPRVWKINPLHNEN
jgi:hypothetical protein